MSGAVNSVGSNSGMIGQGGDGTELDYEEGSCTMNYTGATTTGTHGARTGWYTKIGNVVTVHLNLYSASVSGTWAGTLRVSGFPFVCEQYAIFPVRAGGFADSDNHPSQGFLHVGQTYADMVKWNGSDPRNGRTGCVNAANLSSYDEIYFSCTYLTTGLAV